MIYFKIFSLFLYNEIKIILVKVRNYIIFLREINIYNTLTTLLKNENININFSNNYFNRYLDTISKIRKKRKINSDYKIIVEGFINQPEYQINNLIDSNDLDGLVGLTRNPAWKTDHKNGDSRTGDGDLSFGNGGLSAVAGYPHITIPLDYVNGLPVGVSFLGKAWEEAKIINFAYDFEQENNFFPRPTRGKN